MNDVAVEHNGLDFAVYSKDGKYRYYLERVLPDADPSRLVAFIMLNPSTATAFKNDPTVARCIRYARDWGYGVVSILNLFALRSTDPQALYEADDPVGPLNDIWTMEIANGVEKVVCAWGTHGLLHGRQQRVVDMLRRKNDLYFLRLNANGTPAHPLYLPKHLTPTPWDLPEKFEAPKTRNGPQKRKKVDLP